MSEYRYFLAADAAVTPTAVKPSEVAEYRVAHPYDAEVQVVPLDAIVIPRDELPEVEDANEYGEREARFTPFIGTHDGPNTTPGWHHARALAHLTLATHLREHPPVDEEQVKALSALVDAVEDDLKGHYGEPADGFARALLATGRVKVEP